MRKRVYEVKAVSTLHEIKGIVMAYNKKQADEAAERDLKQQKLKEENALLVKEHDTLGDRNYQELTKIYKDAGGPQFYIKRGEQDTVGRPKMIEWLKKNKYKYC